MSRRRKLLLAGSIVLLEVIAASLAWCWLRKDEQEQELLLRPIPAQLAPGLYLLGNSLPSAVYVVETTDGLVLVDSGRDPEGFSVTHQITRLGLDPERIRAASTPGGATARCCAPAALGKGFSAFSQRRA